MKGQILFPRKVRKLSSVCCLLNLPIAWKVLTCRGLVISYDIGINIALSDDL